MGVYYTYTPYGKRSGERESSHGKTGTSAGAGGHQKGRDAAGPLRRRGATQPVWRAALPLRHGLGGHPPLRRAHYFRGNHRPYHRLRHQSRRAGEPGPHRLGGHRGGLRRRRGGLYHAAGGAAGGDHRGPGPGGHRKAGTPHAPDRPCAPRRPGDGPPRGTGAGGGCPPGAARGDRPRGRGDYRWPDLHRPGGDDRRIPAGGQGPGG